jgi:hypothetical protein
MWRQKTSRQLLVPFRFHRFAPFNICFGHLNRHPHVMAADRTDYVRHSAYCDKRHPSRQEADDVSGGGHPAERQTRDLHELPAANPPLAISH